MLEVGPRWSPDALVAIDGNRASARIALPAELGGDVHHWSFHPALADLATGLGVMLRVGDGLHVPTRYEHIQIDGQLGTSLDVVAVRRDDSTEAELVIDLDLSSDGSIVARLRGLHLDPGRGRRRRARGVCR